jgi:hypothetical protein
VALAASCYTITMTSVNGECSQSLVNDVSDHFNRIIFFINGLRLGTDVISWRRVDNEEIILIANIHIQICHGRTSVADSQQWRQDQ